MPRYYRRRYTRTLVKPKKKWASNIISLSTTTVGGDNQIGYVATLCQNSSLTSNPTPVVLKTGNFKLQCDAYFNMSTNSAVEFSAYIAYVPEGITFTTFDDIANFIGRHPEWIMAWKYSSFDYVSGTANIDSVRASSRLKRNLNSGDKIMFLGMAITDIGVTYTAQGVRGKCQFWTCAN